MTKKKQQLIDDLNAAATKYADDPEAAHVVADKLLLDYIGDVRVDEAHEKAAKWYA